MPNITTNTITFESTDDLDVIKEYMNRIHPADMVYQIQEITGSRIVISNLALENDLQYFDTETNFFDFGNRYMPDKYDTLASHLDEIHIGDYLIDNRVRNNTGGRHFLKLTPEEFETQKRDKFNFQWIEPQPNTVTNFIANEDHTLTQPGTNDPDFWYAWNVHHWNTKWNAMEALYDDQYLTFLTAWDNVEPLIDKLAKKFPKIQMQYDIDYEGDDEVESYLYNY